MSGPVPAVKSIRQRRTTGVLSAGLTLGLALSLTACGGGNANPASSPAAPSTSAAASTSASPTASASASASTAASGSSSASTGTSSSPAASSTTTAPSSAAAAPTTINLDQDLPAGGPNESSYDGEPRLVADVHHLGCLKAQDAEIPESEADARDIGPVATAMNISLEEGWKLCMVGAFESFSAPASFDVQPTASSAPDNVKLTILDADGQRIGGYTSNIIGDNDGQELLEVISVEPLPQNPYTGSLTRYLRTLVVQGSNGPVLLVDQVSAASEDEAKTLEAWTIHSEDESSQHIGIWAQIPLASADDADDVVGTRLHEVLMEMVGSYEPPVQ